MSACLHCGRETEPDHETGAAPSDYCSWACECAADDIALEREQDDATENRWPDWTAEDEADLRED